MNSAEARETGGRLLDLAYAGQVSGAYDLLVAVFAQRTPFPLLERIGEELGSGPSAVVDPLLEHIARQRNEGGWVIIGRTLRGWLDHDLVGALQRCRRYVVAGDVWYAADILGERVPGPALLADFEHSLALLTPWREDPHRWVRRAAGVAIHFWAKRARGAPGTHARAGELLGFLEPVFEEHEQDAIKGLGWGLKTLGKYYPDPTAAWLEEQLVHRKRHPRALMLRKALTYLSPVLRTGATKGTAR